MTTLLSHVTTLRKLCASLTTQTCVAILTTEIMKRAKQHLNTVHVKADAILESATISRYMIIIHHFSEGMYKMQEILQNVFQPKDQ